MPDDTLPANTAPTPDTSDVTCSTGEDRYRVLVEQAPFCLFEIGLDGTILWANQAGLQFARLSNGDAIAGMTFASIIENSAQEQVDRWLHEAFGGTTCRFEFASGSTNLRNCKASLVPIRDTQGKVTRLMCMAEDITDHKRIEDLLAVSEDRFRTVADYTLDWEYWDGPQHEMLYMSPSCQRITGYTREDFLADPALLTRITHPQDMALFQCHRHDMNKDEDGAMEYRIVHRDGSVRWIDHRCHPVHSADGLFRGRRISNREVTERKKAEARANELLHVAQHTYGLILAGGRGTRLQQLTADRSKPAIPFGGKLKIIDFPLSNCVNSGVRRVGVLTQYKAQSLIRHLERGWGFLEHSLKEYIDVVPAQQQINSDWYSGTADAVYQNLGLLDEANPLYVLVLAGDHIYKMDYTRILADHVNSAADLTVACIELPLHDVSGFGVMAVDDNARVTAFEEKPAHPTPIPGNPGYALASMGIYVFNANFLREQLRQDAANKQSSHDFGRDLIPRLIHSHHVQAHRFADSCVNMIQGRPYWRDVGTVDAYWEANIDLTHVVPDLNLYDENWPIRSVHEHSAPAKFVFREHGLRGMALDSLVSSGCIISGATVSGSVLFTKVRVAEYSLVEDSVLLPEVVVGRNVILKRAVVDNGCIIPDGFQVGVNPDADRVRFHVTSRGITLITPEMLSQPTHRVL
jgi:glucose-1-phosphate adenylyltransferase